MNGVQRRGGGKWKTLRERLGFKGIGCGGAIWGFGASSNMRVREEEDEEDDDHHHYHQEQADLHQDEMLGDVVGQIPVENNNTEQDCVGQIPAVASGVNLAMALAAERHFRAAQDWDDGGVGVVGTTGSSEATTATETIMNSSNIGTPMRVSLMRLLEDGDVDGEEEEEEEKQRRTEGGGGGGTTTTTTEEGNDVVCCVCMRRKKGAAFIPCGHTFCRVCSRELWLNRGSCPLCNRSILEILDIF